VRIHYLHDTKTTICLLADTFELYFLTHNRHGGTNRRLRLSGLKSARRWPRFTSTAIFCGAYVLSRNIPYEAELVDQPFTSSKKRLARILLLLSLGGDLVTCPRVSSEN